MFYLTLKKRPWDDQFFFSWGKRHKKLKIPHYHVCYCLLKQRERERAECCSPASDAAQMNSLNTCPNTWGLLFHCDPSPHCKITINLKTNYPRSLRWLCLLDLFRTLTKEELHVIFKRHMKVGLQHLSGCCCTIEDIHFSIKALKWQELFGLKRTPGSAVWWFCTCKGRYCDSRAWSAKGGLLPEIRELVFLF